MTDSILVINEYEGSTANKRQLFGIRAFGELDKWFWKSLYEEFNPTYDEADFPWSYLAFNEQDELRFRQKYKDYIEFVEKDPEDEPYDCFLDKKKVELTPQQQEEYSLLYKILQEEILKEINREVINKINEASK